LRPDPTAGAVCRVIFAPEDARRLAAVRIGLCSLLAVRLEINDYGAVADQPAALYQPLSYMKLVSSMPSHGLASTAQVIGIAAALLAAAGLWIRVSLPLAFACGLLLNGMLGATGKAVHNDVLLTLCLIPLLVAPSASTDAWAVRVRRKRFAGQFCGEAYGWQIRTAMAVVASAYFLVGVQKLRYSGIAWATSDNLRWILYASHGGHPNAVALFVADRAPLAHALAAATLVFETSFPIVLFWPRARWLFIPGAIALHVGIRLALGLDYSAWWLTVLIVFVNWPLVVGRLRSLAPSSGPRVESPST
jgi:hypothetical protein